MKDFAGINLGILKIFAGIDFRGKCQKTQNRESFCQRKFLTLKYMHEQGSSMLGGLQHCLQYS